jgi:hypothetical protein
MEARHERQPDQQSEVRGPYEPPAVSWEEDFTPYAFSTCGKMPGQSGGCASNKSS